LVDLASVDDVGLAPAPPTLPAERPVQPAAPSTAPAQDTAVSGAALARNHGELPGHRAPRPDTGTEEGKKHPPAMRPDRSTLHERLSDGAAVDQLAHSATASSATTPQALRREPLPGEGDSVATHHPLGAPPSAWLAVPAADEPGSAPMHDRRGPPRSEESAGEPTAVQDRLRPAGEGPLDAERGPRTFDVDHGGPARDVESRRAASTDVRPGRLDLMLASAPGPGLAGRGAGTSPGESASPSLGTAEARQGGRSAGGLSEGDAARERQYLRYHQEIARRVAQALVFPRRLALHLEQGETIVRFAVLPSGHLAGPVELQKSSGFEEFDQAARRAVEMGAPFPPLPPALRAQALPVSLRVPFENPMVR